MYASYIALKNIPKLFIPENLWFWCILEEASILRIWRQKDRYSVIKDESLR